MIKNLNQIKIGQFIKIQENDLLYKINNLFIMYTGYFLVCHNIIEEQISMIIHLKPNSKNFYHKNSEIQIFENLEEIKMFFPEYFI